MEEFLANTKGYRFGFNGKEYLPELSGESNTQDYGMRIYNTRIGKFLSIDPLERAVPWWSSYQFAGNTPVWAIDFDGLQPVKMSATINGVNYKFVFQRKFWLFGRMNGSKFKIKSDPGGTTHFSFRTQIENSTKTISMELLMPGRAQQLPGSTDGLIGATKSDQTDMNYLMNSTHNGILVRELIVALIQQNSTQLELNIVGNHNVPGTGALFLSDNILYAGVYPDPDQPGQSIGSGYYTNEEVEKWTQLRADYVKQMYFMNGIGIKGLSRSALSQKELREFGMKRIEPFGRSKMGVSIAFRKVDNQPIRLTPRYL